MIDESGIEKGFSRVGGGGWRFGFRGGRGRGGRTTEKRFEDSSLVEIDHESKLFRCEEGIGRRVESRR